MASRLSLRSQHTTRLVPATRELVPSCVLTFILRRQNEIRQIHKFVPSPFESLPQIRLPPCLVNKSRVSDSALRKRPKIAQGVRKGYHKVPRRHELRTILAAVFHRFCEPWFLGLRYTGCRNYFQFPVLVYGSSL